MSVRWVFDDVPTPAPEGCHPLANGINCNFDRQEAQVMWVLDQFAYVLMAIAIIILVLAIRTVITGRSPIPARITRLLPRVPASIGDRRRFSAAVAILTTALLLNLVSVHFSFPGGFGYPAGPFARSPLTILGPFAMILGLLVFGGIVLGVRYLDRNSGTVASAMDQLRGRPALSPDGMHYWDGRSWVTTISPDGRYRWNGRGWVPVEDVRES